MGGVVTTLGEDNGVGMRSVRLFAESRGEILVLYDVFATIICRYLANCWGKRNQNPGGWKQMQDG